LRSILIGGGTPRAHVATTPAAPVQTPSACSADRDTARQDPGKLLFKLVLSIHNSCPAGAGSLTEDAKPAHMPACRQLCTLLKQPSQTMTCRKRKRTKLQADYCRRKEIHNLSAAMMPQRPATASSSRGAGGAATAGQGAQVAAGQAAWQAALG
jgi:hypothetical protein